MIKIEWVLSFFTLSKLLEIYENSLEKTDPSEIENLQYKKTADSVILSLFVRTNGKCNNSHAPAS